MRPMRLFLMLLVTVLCTNLYAQTPSCPPNLDFEQGNYSNWEFFTGNCCPINAITNSGPVANRHVLTSGLGTDPYGGFPIVAPGGGQFSLKLGNDGTGAQAERARYYLTVPTGSTKYILIYRYAVVFEDPNHNAAQQPTFQVKAYDANGNLIPCNEFNYVASANIPGFSNSTVRNGVLYKPWSSGSIDLSAYSGQTIAIDFSTGDCAAGGHFGYGYIDMDCSTFETYQLICGTGSSTVEVTGPPGYDQYKWMDENFTVTYGVGQNLFIPTPGQTTTYAVILTPYQGVGCEDTFYTTVGIFVPKLSNDTVLCGQNKSAQLHAFMDVNDAPFTYTWTPSNTLSCTNCPNPVASPSASTNYIVTIKGASGCTKIDTITVGVGLEVNADIKLVSDTSCQYAEALLENIGVCPPTAFHHWTINGGKVIDGEGTPKATGSWNTEGNKWVYLEVIDGACIDYDTAQIWAKPASKASFTVNNHVCIGDSVIVRPLLQDGTYHWTVDEWSLTDNSFQKAIGLSWNTLGRKKISLSVHSPNGCIAPSFDTTINVHEYPTTKISIDGNYVCMEDTLRLHVDACKDCSYEWKPVNAMVRNNLSNVQAIVSRDMLISAQITSEWGCASKDGAYVSPIHCCEIMMPDAFTPNGDGRNDVFRIVSEGFQRVHTFAVFNRWGQRIFETSAQNVGWDGTYKGVKQDPGTYTYYIKYKCTDQSQGKDQEYFERKGNFILLR